MQWKSISCRYLRTIMIRFEAGPAEVNGVPWPRCPDGGALKAYQCSANKWTIAFGVRWHPDGREVREGDTITPEQVWEYTDAAVARVEADIRSVVTIDMEPHQYAGVVFWVYNLGISALKKTVDGESQLLPKINAGRWLDVASAMSVFVYATTTKQGKTWKRAMFGLFLRRSAEGCLVMGCAWEDACDPDRLSLPTRTDWQPTLNRYYDVVLEGKTPFLNVYRDAKAYPLDTKPEPTITVIIDKPTAEDVRAKSFEDLVAELPPLDLTPAMQADPPESVAVEKAGAPELRPNPAPASPADEKTVAASPATVQAGGGVPINRPPPPVVKPAPVPPVVVAGQDGVKPPSPNTVPINGVPYKIDPNAGLKPMEETDRWKSSMIQNAGMLLIRLSRYGAFGTGLKATADVVEQDGVLMQTFQMFFLVAAMAIVGYTVRVYGDWRRRRAEAVAGQAMY